MTIKKRHDRGNESWIPTKSVDKRKLIGITEEILEEKLFCRLVDRNFAVFIKFLTSDLSLRSVRERQVAMKVLEVVYPEN